MSGPCNCCGKEVIYLEKLTDEDGWYYCAECCKKADEDERMYG